MGGDPDHAVSICLLLCELCKHPYPSGSPVFGRSHNRQEPSYGDGMNPATSVTPSLSSVPHNSVCVCVCVCVVRVRAVGCARARVRVCKMSMPMRFVELDACLTMRVASC